MSRRDRALKSEERRGRVRLVHRDGRINVRYLHLGIEPIASNFFLMTTLSSWSRLAAIYAAIFACSWLTFAILYYIIGDVQPTAIGNDFGPLSNASQFKLPCIEHVSNFLATLLFSIETQHTIGYGRRRPTTNCFSTILILIIQSIVALFIQNITAQAVYMKFSRPHFTVLRKPAFEPRCFLQLDPGGRSYLRVYIVHHERLEIIASKICLFCYKQRVTAEGEVIPYECYQLDILKECRKLPLFLSVHLPISHLIDETSPLKDINETNLKDAQFEIVVTLDGIFQVTGNPCHFRTSYLPDDVKIIRPSAAEYGFAGELLDSGYGQLSDCSNEDAGQEATERLITPSGDV